jgi:hypothetical protein
VSLGRLGDALNESRRLVGLDPLSPVGNALLAVDLAANGQREEAMGRARRAVELEPKFAQAYMVLGTLQYLLGSRVAAAETLVQFPLLRGYPANDVEAVRAVLAGTGPIGPAVAVIDRFVLQEWEPESRLVGLYALVGAKIARLPCWTDVSCDGSASSRCCGVLQPVVVTIRDSQLSGSGSRRGELRCSSLPGADNPALRHSRRGASGILF